MTSFDDIETERLRLRLMPAKVLRALVRQDYYKVADALCLALPVGLEELPRLASLRLKQLKADPRYGAWSLRAVILKETAAMVGYCNFHGLPGTDGLERYGGAPVEIGYTVLPAHRRRGYAAETVSALIPWARSRGADGLVLSIAPDNVASLGLAARLDAVKVGEQIDEEDGLEYVFLRRPL